MCSETFDLHVETIVACGDGVVCVLVKVFKNCSGGELEWVVELIVSLTVLF